LGGSAKSQVAARRASKEEGSLSEPLSNLRFYWLTASTLRRSRGCIHFHVRSVSDTVHN
jgi:hypothetical protein